MGSTCIFFYMEHDPTASRKLVIPSTKKTEYEAITMEEFQDILVNLGKLQLQDRCLMALLMMTDMRRGDALGLQWNDIDWEKGFIHVRRNVTFAGNQPHVGTPKTEKGTRQIPILSDLRPDRRDGHQDAAGHRRTCRYPDYDEPLRPSAKRQNRGDREARYRPVCAKNVQKEVI